MTKYDTWLTTNRTQEASEALHEAFHRSDDYMSAYFDYCDDFDSSRAYDSAFDNWISDDFGDEDDDPRQQVGELEWTENDIDGMAYYGLHAEDVTEAWVEE